MPTIADGSHVTLHYRLSTPVAADERDIASTFGGQPATLTVGAGHLAPALEACLVGLAEGARERFSLPAGSAYGQRRPELVQTLTRALFDANADPATEYRPGDVVEFTVPEGGRLAGVLKRRDERQVVVDFNHPLADLPLTFDVQVIGVL